MGRSYITHEGVDEKFRKDLSQKLMERDHLENLDLKYEVLKYIRGPQSSTAGMQ
jgi:hypothetical protein